MTCGPAREMIMDACVLIDFIKTERALLELVVKHVGRLYVPSPVVNEVNEIDDENELVELGLNIIEPEIKDAYDAAASASQYGALSFEDWLCLLTAKRHGFICVTNDKKLRKFCERGGVSLLWGLELIAELHKVDGLTTRGAETIARELKRLNPNHITDEIITRFIKTMAVFKRLQPCEGPRPSGPAYTRTSCPGFPGPRILLDLKSEGFQPKPRKPLLYWLPVLFK